MKQSQPGPLNFLAPCGTPKERHRHEGRNDGLPWLNGRLIGETFCKNAIGKGDAKAIYLMDLLRIVAERNLAQVELILRGIPVGDDAPEPVSRTDLAARLAEGSVTVLDIRPADEYAAGHIPGARNATLAHLEQIIPTLAHDSEIVAYGRRPYCVYAHQAVATLRRHGLNARRLEAGLPEWRDEGRPVIIDASLTLSISMERHCASEGWDLVPRALPHATMEPYCPVTDA